MLNDMLDWARNRWGYVGLALDSDGFVVIKTVDGRCERWLCTGINAHFDFVEQAVQLVIFDSVSNLTYREYQVAWRSEHAVRCLDSAADEQDKDIGELDYCPKCYAHKMVQFSQGRAMKLCSNYAVCSGKSKTNGRIYPLEHLNADQQLFLLSHGNDDLGYPAGAIRASMTRKLGLTTGEELSQSTVGLSLVEDHDLIKTSEFTLLNYPFSHFNRVQSTLLKNQIHTKNVNLVLGTATSSGKTVCAELCMAHTLAKGEVVVYVSPLRSLTQEKYDDWSHTFGAQYKIAILTGDYALSPDKNDEINQADILCITSEMLDSRTRKYGSERSAWIDRVGLLVVDESHIIGTERGHAVEAGLMRFTQFNQAKVLFMSATMPNVEQFAQWLSVLNGLQSEIINSPWRPTPLTWHFPRYVDNGNYKQSRDSRINEALKKVTDAEKSDEKYLLFVHDKATGAELLRKVRAQGIDAEFHSADLKVNVRQQIEKEFKDPHGKLRVLVSTSTLAWGCNVPAQNVVIVGTTRGLSPVEIEDILQMAGRAGRSLPADYFVVAPDGNSYAQSSLDRLSLRILDSVAELDMSTAGSVIDIRHAGNQQDIKAVNNEARLQRRKRKVNMRQVKDHQKVILAQSVEEAKAWIAHNDPQYLARYHGHCYLICAQPKVWEHRIQQAKPVHSQLVNEATLGFHILAEVDAGTIHNQLDLVNWFDRSLAKLQGLVEQKVVESVLGDLLRTQMLKGHDEQYEITEIGKVSSRWYYKPEDVFHWHTALRFVDHAQIWDNDDALAWAIAGAPSYNTDYIQRSQAKLVDEYMKRLQRVVPFASEMALPADMATYLSGKTVQYQKINSFKYDLSRVFQALRQIAKACAISRPDGYWHMLETRFRYGTTADSAKLLCVEEVGVMNIRKLVKAGIVSLDDFIDVERRSEVTRILGHKKLETALASARKIIRSQYGVE
ncbi:DEAD/DEAH box helicase [Pseudoalteromonas sp. McH1-7]|uniref:DEAD/DEAH box helicase n=1 Tax=Pseudoalteromonas sp. McH1-7 TaxID=2745574 RepID=UPI001591F261|nr:DEAD/DEAH box helicase [Pseudoalteromonas sp. McH1-7]NUZ11952.1 DEAD/DEAH box helicase [Pseudoalteromonas sp. McH1-7]